MARIYRLDVVDLALLWSIGSFAGLFVALLLVHLGVL